MGNRIRAALAGLTLVAGLALTAAPAHAAASGTMYMTGTSSRDLLAAPTNPAAVDVTGSGEMIGVFGTSAGRCSLTFNGTGVETAAQGSGGGSLTCSGAGIWLACSVSYARVGTVVQFSGSCSGSIGASLRATLMYQPAPPTAWLMSGPFAMS